MMSKSSQISQQSIIVGIVCLAIFLLLLFLNIIQINYRFTQEGYRGRHLAPATFFSQDDPNDKVGTTPERKKEQARVDAEIDEYFDGHFRDFVGHDYESDINMNYDFNKIGSSYYYDLMWSQYETKMRLNYLQHAVDELRGTIELVGKRLFVNSVLH
jgi:hypothetical protein